MAPIFPVELALRGICEQHRNISVVLRTLNRDVRVIASGGMDAEIERVSAMLRYVETFANGVHEPAEEACLFSVMKRRHAPSAIVETAIAAHRDNARSLARLQWAFGVAQERGNIAAGILPAAVAEYIAGQYAHMSFEEETVLPCAIELLEANDWPRIARDFSAHIDPLFGTQPDPAFSPLYDLRPMQQMPQ